MQKGEKEMSEEEKNLHPVNDERNETKEETVSSEVIAEPEAKKKKGGKKPLLIAIAAVVVIAVAAVAAVAASVAASSPISLIGKGFVNSINALKQSDVVAFADKVAKGGSIEVECDMEELLELPVEGIVSMKLYTAAAKMAITAAVEVEGDTVLDASAFVDQTNVAVASDVLLGSETYGISLTNLVDRFHDSEFGPDGELSLGIELPDMTESVVEDAAKMTEESQAIGKAMLAHLLKSIEEHTEISKENESIKFNGTDVKVTAVGIQADSEAAVAVISDLIEYLRSDKELKEYLYNYAEYVAAAMVASDLVYDDYKDAEAIVDEFYDLLEEIEEQDLEDLAEELEEADLELSLTFYITKSGKELVGIKFDGDADGDKVKASVFAGPSWKNLEEVTLRWDDGYSVYRITYAVETNDKKTYSVELKVREDSENILVGEFTWDKEKGNFEAELTDDWGDTYGLEGSLKVDSKTATIVLESAYEDSEEIDLGISLTLTAADKMPAMPSYTDILDMSADELEDVIYDLTDVLYEMSDMFDYY